MRLQLDQLLEFKRAILESQSQLQKELQRVKQEAKDALVEQQSKYHDNEEYQEMLEMATLDKEMAEEKVKQHTFCVENRVCKDFLLFIGRELATRAGTSQSSN